MAEVYYLSGGTALSAFYLEHRHSEDLDFFSGEKDYVDLYCAALIHPEIKIEHLVAAAEKKFGVTGVGHILQGRFLGDIPSLQGLYWKEAIDPKAFVTFFRNQAKTWIARRVAVVSDL